MSKTSQNHSDIGKSTEDNITRHDEVTAEEKEEKK
jgi:hypothetical protein